MSDTSNYRYHFIDQIRGFAVFLMIIFHFSYDLQMFNFVEIDFVQDTFWWIFPRVIVFLFLFSMGLSFPIVHSPKIRWSVLKKRVLLISLFALSISLVTFFLFPTRWIYFGTLHCIALCSIITLPFLKYPKVSLIIALALLIPSIFFKLNLPWVLLKHKSMDYISPFPWMGVVLLGFSANFYNFHKLNMFDNIFSRLLERLGKHSLLIYIIHQPILYSIVFLIHKII
jgi:uncharacterized membrane protein